MKKYLVVVVLLAASTFVQPAYSQTSYSCIGAPADEPAGGLYPEPRQFVDAQSWWTTTPGQSGTDHGHIHVGACIPERETITGSFALNIRMVLHDPGEQKVYSTGSNNPPYTSIVLKDDRIETSSYKLYEAGWTCPTPGTCVRWRSQQVDPAPFTTDGRKEIRFRFFSDVKDGTAEARMTASLNWQFNLDRSNVSTVDNYDRMVYLRGKGWYSNPGSKSSGGYCESDMVSVPLPDTPLAGTWSPTVKMVWHGGSSDPPITSREARLDADFHAGNPGTIIMSGNGEFNGPLSINTATLANGTHRLVLRAICNDKFGRGSDIQGLLVVPFQVAN
jgi:hypothetical protein